MSELTAMMPSDPLRSARTRPSLSMRKARSELVPQSRPIICGASVGASFAISATIGQVFHHAPPVSLYVG